MNATTPVPASAEKSGMDDLFLNRMLFEWLRNRFLSLRFLAASSCGLKEDYPCSDDLEKLPDRFWMNDRELFALLNPPKKGCQRQNLTG